MLVHFGNLFFSFSARVAILHVNLITLLVHKSKIGSREKRQNLWTTDFLDLTLPEALAANLIISLMLSWTVQQNPAVPCPRSLVP